MYNSIKILFAINWIVLFFFMVLGWNPGPGNCSTLINTQTSFSILEGILDFHYLNLLVIVAF